MKRENPYLNRDIDAAVRPQRVIAIAGPPSIGKTTAAKNIQQLFAKLDLPVPPLVSPDKYMYENGVYKWTPQRARASWERAYRELEVLSVRSTGCPVILWESELVSPRERMSLLAQWAHLTRAGATNELLFLPSPGFGELLERNSNLPPDVAVPEQRLRESYNTYANRQHEPTQREGWSTVWRDESKLSENINETIVKYLLEERREANIKSALDDTQDRKSVV